MERQILTPDDDKFRSELAADINWDSESISAKEIDEIEAYEEEHDQELPFYREGQEQPDKPSYDSRAGS